jgi:hypothetical protein
MQQASKKPAPRGIHSDRAADASNRLDSPYGLDTKSRYQRRGEREGESLRLNGGKPRLASLSGLMRLRASQSGSLDEQQ